MKAFQTPPIALWCFCAALCVLAVVRRASAEEESIAPVVAEVLQGKRPDIGEQRTIVIADAVSTVVREFPKHPMLAAALLTAMREESNFMESVHSGDLRGKAGEICMAQIHPRNGFWESYVDDFDALGGLGVEATTNCLRVAARTLQWSRRKCLRENYKTNWAQAMWTRYHYGDRCWLSPHAHKRTHQMKRWHGLLLAEERRQATREEALLGGAAGAALFVCFGAALFRAFSPKPEPYVVEYISPKIDPEELRNL